MQSNQSEAFPQINVEEAIERAKQRVRSARHEWRQRGVWLVCKSCPQEHATWIGRSRVMTGIDENGNPTFADR